MLCVEETVQNSRENQQKRSLNPNSRFLTRRDCNKSGKRQAVWKAIRSELGTQGRAARHLTMAEGSERTTCTLCVVIQISGRSRASSMGNAEKKVKPSHPSTSLDKSGSSHLKVAQYGRMSSTSTTPPTPWIRTPLVESAALSEIAGWCVHPLRDGMHTDGGDGEIVGCF